MSSTSLRILWLGLALVGMTPWSVAQDSLDVTFRFIPDLTGPTSTTIFAAFTPGSFNDWGPNNSGVISPTAPSKMTAVTVDGRTEYVYTRRLQVGGRGNTSDPTGGYTYKIHYHTNASGTSNVWLTDPLGTETFGNNNDSVVRVADPMAFQLARRQDASGSIVELSASLFGKAAFTSISFEVNGVRNSNGLAYFDAATGLFRYTLPTPVPVGSQFSITATDTRGRVVTASVGTIPPTVVDAPRPEGLQDGITYVGTSTVRLSLLAPGKQYVYVLGDFNNWTPTSAFLMTRDSVSADEQYFWLTISGLTPGQTYRFQYLVDGVLRVSDPYCPLVLDGNNDGFIGTTTYPNKPAYPTGQTTDLVCALQPGLEAFPWRETAYERPPPHELVIYELLVRDFIAKHDFQTVRDTLDYLQRLGVNALQLMPVSEFDGNDSWGYNPNHYFAVDKYYGPADSLRALIDECHVRGIAVILDVVYNHQTGQAPFVRLYNEGEYGAPTPDNPWVNPTARHPFNVFNDNNHASVFTQRWLDRANRWWLEEFRVDGFRYDLSKGFTQKNTGDNVGAWGAYDQSRIDLLTRMADNVWAVDSTAYVILEHFADASEERVLANHGKAAGRPGMLLWNNMNRAYSQSAMGYLTDSGQSSDLTRTYSPNNGYPFGSQVTYMESHDEQWLMYRNRAYGPASGSYNVKDLGTALDRLKLAATFFLTVPGPRMIWQFGELGYGWGNSGEQCLEGAGDTCPASAPDRVAAKPIRWDYRTDPQREQLYNVYAALLALRARYEVFRSPATQVQLRVGQGVPDRRIKLDLEGFQVVIIGNFGLTARDVVPAFHATGTWYEYLTGRTVEVADVNAPILLEPGQFFIYTNQAVEPPPLPVWPVADEDGTPDVPTAFVLDAAYPNPTADRVTVAYALPQAATVRLEVFDVLGRRVAVLADEAQAAGRYGYTLDTHALPAGVYVYRLTAAARTATGRFTVVR